MLLGLFGCAPSAPAPNKPAVPRIVIVSIDGLRPDVLLRASAPNLRTVMKNGSYTFWARSADVAMTLPAHVSMLTGVVPGRHEVWWNAQVPEDFFHYPAVPTLFELAKQAGHSTAMAAGKVKFEALRKPGTLDWVYLPETSAEDLEVARQACRLIEDHRPDVLFVHLPGVDAAGHAAGWGSRSQLQAAELADRALGLILSTLRRNRLLESTILIVTADHGGAATGHAAQDPRARHIPWMIMGPGIRRDHDLTLEGDLVINIQDTFSTACFLLNLPLDEDLDAKPILQALVDERG